MKSRAFCFGRLAPVVGLFFWGQPAQAQDQPQRPADNFRFSVTSTSTAIYSGDNRDTRSGEVETLVNDNWAGASERISTQATSGPWVLGLRLDGTYFLTRPDPTQVGLDLVELRRQQGAPAPGEPSDAEYFRQKVYESGSELSNRYINWLVPAKYSIAYRTRTAQVTLGDFYAQFGRGLVLSVRKDDALASDTTVRGARLGLRARVDKTRLRFTALAGSANPLRLDEASGRYLGTQASGRAGFQHVTEAGMPHAIDTDFAPRTGECTTTATCSYAPDNLYGAQIELSPPGLKFATQASLLTRHTILSPDVVRGAHQIFTASQTVEFPSVVDFGSLYLEGAGQERAYEGSASQNGYALYSNLDLSAGILGFVFEGKHYRAFYPLSAGISTARAREFNQVQYSRVPTTEPVWNTTQFENFNTCTSGGRGKLDVHLTRRASVFTWVGRYNTWAESVSNEECEINPENLNRIWDLATGTEIQSRDQRSNTELSVGVRDDTTERNLGTAQNPTYVFYREAYLRYDALFHVSGPYSVQFIGWHRIQNQTLGGPDAPWVVGQTLTALDVAHFGNIAFGFDYDTDPRTPDLYFNGQLTYRISSANTLSLFVGQRRGAQRCIAGVCRVFPPFEGARLDLTLRL
jgi:hypothetical protein